MKPPSKKLWIALIAAVLIVIVISIATGGEMKETQDLASNNVVFINDSDTPVGCVQVEYSRWDGSASHETAMNADGSPLERGAKLYFDANWPAVVTLYADIQGREPLASVVIEEAPPEELQERVWYVIARDGPEGLVLTLSLNLDEDELEQMAENISDNLGVDVTDGHISYCFYPGHGWQGDGEDFVVMHFSQQGAAALTEELSTAEGWQQGAFPAEMKEDTFTSVYDHESHIDWDTVSDSGWFYFRDEREGGTEPYDSSDYVAAVYDPASRMLYFFEWHQ